jgi:hypothetical protein
LLAGSVGEAVASSAEGTASGVGVRAAGAAGVCAEEAVLALGECQLAVGRQTAEAGSVGVAAAAGVEAGHAGGIRCAQLSGQTVPLTAETTDIVGRAGEAVVDVAGETGSVLELKISLAFSADVAAGTTHAVGYGTGQTLSSIGGWCQSSGTALANAQPVDGTKLTVGDIT